MERFVEIARYALPLVCGVATLVVRMLHGSARPWLATSLIVLGGLFLGWTLSLMLESTAHLMGHMDAEDAEDGASVDQQIREAVARRLDREEQP